jgi:hypothetical protein
MNFCLAGIGIQFPKHRERALTIGEKLGIYRDFPVSKGCTSPFAPIWINEMVRSTKLNNRTISHDLRDNSRFQRTALRTAAEPER